MNRETAISGFLWVKLGVLFAMAMSIWVFSLFPGQVENLYSVGVYPGIASTLRILTKWAPFSIGDIIYTWVGILLIISAVKGSILIYRKQYTRAMFLHFLFRVLRMVLWLYIIFKLIWGLNYDRLGIAYQLRIAKNEYSKEEVTQLANQLIDSLNACRRQIKDTLLPVPELDTIYLGAYRAYQKVSEDYDFLNYRNRSVKASLYSGIGDYMGFSGYYNPFTGEAQLRTDIPRILVPYIACHEIAHQLGYASESEANFVGYLAASNSKDVYFRYSVYLDLFSYAQGQEILLYGRDKDFKQFEQVIKHNRDRLDTLVKKDRKEIREFFNKRRNRISPAVSSLYDQYLKMNKQLEGINSYDEVVAWLIAYQKKYGRL
jgi:hypothetical protein